MAFDHFLSPDLAFHASAEKLRAGSRIEFPDAGVSFGAGSLDLNEYTAGFHWYFLSHSVVRPYAGAGVARIQGGKLRIPGDFTNAASMRRFARQQDDVDRGRRHRHHRRHERRGGAQRPLHAVQDALRRRTRRSVQFLKLNPVTFGAGFRWKF